MNKTLIAAAIAVAALSSGVAGAEPQNQGGQSQGDAAHGDGQPHGGGANHGRQGGSPGRQGQGSIGQGGAMTTNRPAVTTTSPGAVHGGARFGHVQSGAGQDHRLRTTQPSGARPANPSGFMAGGNGGGRSGGQFVYRGRPRSAIHGSGFSYPSGWGYRRWGVGQSLPFLFLSSPYFFSDYYSYGFGAPPRGYVWVRYGPDLLLVSRRTGHIREVIYGVFY